MTQTDTNWDRSLRVNSWIYSALEVKSSTAQAICRTFNGGEMMKSQWIPALAGITLTAAFFAASPSSAQAQDFYYGPPAFYAPGYYAPPAVVYPAPVTVYRGPIVEPYYVARPPLVSVHAGPVGVYVPRPWRPRWEHKIYTPYGVHEYEYKLHRNGYVSVDYDFDD